MWSRDCLILSTCSTPGRSHCMVGLIAGHFDGIRVTVETKHGLTIKVDTPHMCMSILLRI